LTRVVTLQKKFLSYTSEQLSQILQIVKNPNYIQVSFFGSFFL
jgi:hypothetical protein